MHESNSSRTFNVDFDGFKIFASIQNEKKSKNALMIHGGARNHEIFNPLAQWMITHFEMGTLTFDCIGHGLSEGQFSDSSLMLRTQLAQHLIQHSQCEVHCCIGVSMGAYNAIKLSTQLNLDSLVLIVPGVYTPTAYPVHFGDSFSEIIRIENSWLDSDAWEILNAFQGRLLIVSAECDEVVPAAIPKKLYQSASNAAWKKHLIIPEAVHKKFMEQLWDHDQHRIEFLSALTRCISI